MRLDSWASKFHVSGKGTHYEDGNGKPGDRFRNVFSVADSYTKGIIIMRKYPATTIIITAISLSLMSIAAVADVLPDHGLY